MITRGLTESTLITRGLTGRSIGEIIREIKRLTSAICLQLNITSRIRKIFEGNSRV